MIRKLSAFMAILAFTGWLAAPHPAWAGAAIANGSGLYMGINDEGHHNFPTGIGGLPANSGFLGIAGTFPDGSVRDATSPGCQCEGWGVAGSGISGFANVSSDGGATNLTVMSFGTSGGPVGTPFGPMPTSATSTVSLTSLSDLMVTHAYSPSSSPFLFQGDVTITNTGGGTITDIRYRRVMDWDVPPDEFNEFVTHGGLPATNVLFMSDQGFATADPLGTVGFGPGDVFPDIGGCGFGNFVDCGPTDHGTVIDFGFGDLGPGESKTFTIFYGAAPSEVLAIGALASVSAEVFSLGQWSGDPAGGTPLTFIFAFKGVGGTPVTPVPLPQSLALLGLGLGAALWLHRRLK